MPENSKSISTNLSILSLFSSFGPWDVNFPGCPRPNPLIQVNVKEKMNKMRIFLKMKKEKLGVSMNENCADNSKNKMKLTSGLHQLSSQANEVMIKSMGERAMNCGPFLQMRSWAGLCVC